MKSKIFILAIYIGFLTVQPVVEQIYFTLTHHSETCGQSCCAKKHTDNSKQEPGNCCHNGACNFICTCCFLYSPPQPPCEFKRVFVQIKLLSLKDSKIVLGFLSDCFHPPEIV